MKVNLVIIIFLLVVMISGIYIYYTNRRKTVSDFLQASKGNKNQLSEASLLEHVKKTINDYTRENLLDRGYSEGEYKKQRDIRKKLKKALKHSKHGSLQDKEVVKDHIFDILRQYIGESINETIPFNHPLKMTVQDEFEVLLYVYKVVKGHQFDAFAKLIQQEDNPLDRQKNIIEKGSIKSYIVTDEEIHELFSKEIFLIENLSYRDKLSIITQRIYQQFKGLGVIDEIRDMAIDGVSGGVSGEIESAIYDLSVDEYIHNVNHVAKFYDSVWVMLSGRTINLSFLSFGSEEELRRVCQNIYSYNKVGQLSERSGYKINEMADGSRVVVVRPPFSESWAFFVRKFTLRDMDLEDLYDDKDLVSFLNYLVKGARIIGVTGAQGTGKTTILMALVKSIYATLTLRVQETAFELHLRNVYPMRNILTFRETDAIRGQEGLDVQKKTDGSVNIIGEVATDPVASWTIQASQVASLFTIFTHHAKTSVDLVLALRNSMLREKVFSSEEVAEKQVAQVLNYDIHLSKDSKGRRFIERITEINVTSQEDYPMDFMEAGDSLEAQKAFYKTQTEYFRRRTDRALFETKDVLRFEKGRYTFKEQPSDENIQEMMSHMDREDQEGFAELLEKVWGDIAC